MQIAKESKVSVRTLRRKLAEFASARLFYQMPVSDVAAAGNLQPSSGV